MATYHLNVKFGGKGQAANHADYIERKEKYRDRQDLNIPHTGTCRNGREIIPHISGRRLTSLNVRTVRLSGT